jgi:competence protein ComEA
MDWQTLVREHWWQVLLVSLGVVLMGFGVWQLKTSSQGEEVRITEALPSSGPIGQTIVVDVAGAVGRPGVYRLDQGARVADALIAAQGLAPEADQAWIARRVNQAEIAKDGMKIYIPSLQEASGNGKDQMTDSKSGAVAGEMDQTININTASVAELDSLWGIGAARAQAIIQNRPYGSVAELSSKAGIPQNVIEANQGKLAVY